jgi:hypothetical protein
VIQTFLPNRLLKKSATYFSFSNYIKIFGHQTNIGSLSIGETRTNKNVGSSEDEREKSRLQNCAAYIFAPFANRLKRI